ncbi:MAG: precorrin-3B C(17)-methyltransferase [Epulopiscium sp. Nuni2H_MBin003]|nr:MAG: precorrin-3B C(17)-methyltransferase [Epulopiscium sp. Nuni2H_MBin003]
MTINAINALENSDVIVGYHVYIDLIKERFADKEFYQTPMMGEVDRCKKAIEIAKTGKTVSVISSGDSGVYGMATLVYELAEADIEIEVVAGVTAALSGGAVLGAPIAHDFSLISLSDLLTPYQLIKKRIDAVSSADMCIVIYNPSSKKRSAYLSECVDIIIKNQGEDIVCGVVRNIGRENTEYKLMTLKELKDYPVDMFCTVFIGNSQTKIINNKMITTRGYKIV